MRGPFLVTIIVVTSLSPGCRFFYLGRTPLEVAAEDSVIARGVSVDTVHEILGQPYATELKYGSSYFRYRFRSGELGSAFQQLVLGIVTLGVAWFDGPPWKEQGVLIIGDIVVGADVRLSDAPDWPQKRDALRPRTEILSDPPGARVEVDNEYVGNAPLEYTWGFLGARFMKNRVVRALPVVEGQFSQTKQFEPDQSVPRRMIFDTTLDSVRPKERIQIENR